MLDHIEEAVLLPVERWSSRRKRVPVVGLNPMTIPDCTRFWRSVTMEVGNPITHPTE